MGVCRDTGKRPAASRFASQDSVLRARAEAMRAGEVDEASAARIPSRSSRQWLPRRARSGLLSIADMRRTTTGSLDPADVPSRETVQPSPVGYQFRRCSSEASAAGDRMLRGPCRRVTAVLRPLSRYVKYRICGSDSGFGRRRAGSGRRRGCFDSPLSSAGGKTKTKYLAFPPPHRTAPDPPASGPIRARTRSSGQLHGVRRRKYHSLLPLPAVQPRRDASGPRGGQSPPSSSTADLLHPGLRTQPARRASDCEGEGCPSRARRHRGHADRRVWLRCQMVSRAASV